MGISGRHKLRNLVPHPRYGGSIIASGYDFSAEAVRSSFWRYSSENIFPETAIPADVSKQNYSVFPRPIYVDILKDCRSCGRRFIFFAKEQRHWYEVLRFFIDADCVDCPECRADSQQVRRRFRRYGRLICRTDLSDGELETLTADAAFLAGQGHIRDQGKLGHLRNAARKRIPESPAVKELSDILGRMRRNK